MLLYPLKAYMKAVAILARRRGLVVEAFPISPLKIRFEAYRISVTRDKYLEAMWAMSTKNTVHREIFKDKELRKTAGHLKSSYKDLMAIINVRDDLSTSAI